MTLPSSLGRIDLGDNCNQSLDHDVAEQPTENQFWESIQSEYGPGDIAQQPKAHRFRLRIQPELGPGDTAQRAAEPHLPLFLQPEPG